MSKNIHVEEQSHFSSLSEKSLQQIVKDLSALVSSLLFTLDRSKGANQEISVNLGIAIQASQEFLIRLLMASALHNFEALQLDNHLGSSELARFYAEKFRLVERDWLSLSLNYLVWQINSTLDSGRVELIEYTEDNKLQLRVWRE